MLLFLPRQCGSASSQGSLNQMVWKVPSVFGNPDNKQFRSMTLSRVRTLNLVLRFWSDLFALTGVSQMRQADIILF